MIVFVDSQKKIKKALKTAFLSFFIIALTLAYFIPWGQKMNSPAALEASASSNTVPQSAYPLRNWNSENLQIPALAGISVQVGDGPNKVLFAKSETKQLPVASLTKLMTALVVFEHYDVNQVHDLLFSMLIESSNEAAEALSGIMGQEAFVAAMNDRAKKLGMTSTHFADSSGLNPQSVSSAKDVATLAQYLFEHYPLFRQIVGLKTYGVMKNTNKLLGQDNIVGGKTGFTDEAGECMMVVQTSPQTGTHIISVVLGSSDRFAEIKHIIDWVGQVYTWQ